MKASADTNVNTRVKSFAGLNTHFIKSYSTMSPSVMHNIQRIFILSVQRGTKTPGNVKEEGWMDLS